MNHIYRIVWSRVRNMFVVASEHASSVVRGTRAARRGGVTPAVQFAFTLSAFGALFYLQAVAASGVEVAGGNTRVFNAPNGVQVIDIATVNGAGVSHNRFVQYNVAPTGQVLNNNSPLSQNGAMQSQLAGQVVANMNLVQEARLILNEVVATNRSELLGYTEVLGGKADVIVANPYGITCAGCGFINTDRALLTTGVPVFDGNGGIARFEVRQGDILVNGNGLDGRNQNVLDLVARTIRVESQINARNLSLVAGGNDYNYANGTATAVAVDGNTPLYAIDSTALGGMYANRIRLIATEQGVGVYMRGEAAATADDFTLTAAGRIEVASQISAKRDLQLTYNGNQARADAIDLKASTAELSAGRDLRVISQSGGLELAAGKLTADRDIDISVASLSDVSEGVTRYAARNARLLTPGAAVIDGAVWGAGNDLDLRAGSLSIDGGASLYSGGVGNGTRELRLVTSAGDLVLGDVELQAPGRVSWTSAGALTTTEDTVLQSAADIAVRAASNILHAGRLQTGTALALNAGGDIHVATSGSLLADGALTLSALQAFEHAGRLQSGGGMSLSTGTSLSALDGSTILSAGDLDAEAGTDLDLAGEVQSGASTTLEAQRDIRIADTADLQSEGAVDIDAGAAIRHAGALRAGSDVSLDAATRIDTIAGSSLHADGDVEMLAGTALDHAGTLEATGAVTLDAGQNLSTAATGTLNAGGALLLDAGGTIVHRGTAQSADALTLLAQSSITTHTDSSLRAAQALAVTAGGAFTHSGILVGGGTGTINAGGTFANQWVVHTADNLTVNAAGITNSQVAGLSSLKTLSLTATQNGSIDNRGALYAGEAMSLTATGGTVRNRVGGTIDSSGTFDSTSAYFTNNGAVVINGDAHIRTTQAFVNQTLDSQGNEIRKERDASSLQVIRDNVNKIANEGGFSGDSGMYAWLHDEEYTIDERFIGLTAAQVQALTKAQIIVNGSGSTLSIDYGASGLNSGGVISAPTLNIGGTGTFSNQDLTLHRYTMVRRWISIEDEKTIGSDIHTVWARIDPTREGWDGDIDDDDYNAENWNPGWGWLQGSSTYGGDFPAWLDQEARELSLPGSIMDGAVVIASSGAGIFATDFNFTSGTLKNVGSPWPDDESKVRLGSARNGSLNTRSESLDLSPNSNPTLNLNLAIPGFNVTLPTNPNGYFVISKDPEAKYLVETNPLFGVGSDFVGSDYLAERYGFNPDTVQKRLGDANYEAYLIRQQLIEQTGSNLIKGQQNEAAQMQKLMDNAYAQGQALGLEFGKPLTPAQMAGLTQDIVWMETTVVAGQEVLVPRVYLAASTVAALSSGAVIGGENVNIAGDGLENTGGTIEGSGTLTVNTTGDIRNSSGTLKGGDVSLTSTEGGVVNETLAVGAGDDTTYRTAIGKTGGIQATNNLAIDAAKNVEIIGATVKAGGDASIAAGENIVVDTIVDRSTDTTTTSSSGFLSSSRTRTSTTTETNIGSELDIGGNLSLKSGGDTVVGGSDVKVGGNLDADTGGDFRIEARQDTQTVDTQTTKSGFGVGGGLYGAQKTSIDDFTGTNVGSTLSVGGNATVDSGGKMVIQGSDVNIGGNADIKATEGIAVLDGLDERRTSTTVETTTFLKIDGDSKAGASSSAQDLSADAQAGASASGNFKLAEMSVTNTESGSNTSVGSNLNVGGNLNMQSDGGVTVQGSNVNAGGDLSIEAKSLDVLTGRNESWSDSQTDRASIGIYTDSNAGASASASGGAAQAKAQAGGSFTATAGMRTENEQSSEYSLKNVGSTLTSGGNMDLKVTDTATFQGATVSSGGDMNIEAQDIRNVAAQDIEQRSDSSSRETSGLYVGGEAKASAQLNSGADVGGAGASVSAEASAGLRHAREQMEGASGSVTQVTNTFTSGGDFTRKAQDSIVDQGTQVQAGGNITQSARTIRDEEVHDTTYSSSSSQSHDARIGVAASAGAGASTGGGVDAPNAGVGGKASYDGSWADAAESESKAVTSRFQAGGNINSTSQDETVLTGTQFQAGKDINIEAGSLEVRAARDTSSSSSSKQDVSADVKISSSSASASAELGHQTRDSDSSTARTGSLDAGGQLNIKVRDNASFEGTQMSGDQGIRIDAGSVDLKSAESTSSSSSTDVSAGFSLSSETKDGKTTDSGRGGISGGVSGSSDRSTQDSTLNSGGAVIINERN